MTKPIARRAVSSRPAPMPPPNGPEVDALRTRAVAARAPMSPAVAAVVAALAFGSVPETWRAQA